MQSFFFFVPTNQHYIFGMTPLPFCERRNDDDVGCVSHSSLDGASDRYQIHSMYRRSIIHTEGNSG